MSVTKLVTAAQVTEEIFEATCEIVQGWYGSKGRIDWEDVWYRLEDMTLSDGTTPDLGESMVSAALAELKKRVRVERRSW